MSATQFPDQGHWISESPMDANKYYGFVYKITHRETGRFYIGRKNYRIKGKKCSPHYNKEHAWRTYRGSSPKFIDFIEEQGGNQNFEFKCLQQFSCKGDLVYGEVYYQVIYGVMTFKDEYGIRMAFNGQIAPIKFVPQQKASDKPFPTPFVDVGSGHFNPITGDFVRGRVVTNKRTIRTFEGYREGDEFNTIKITGSGAIEALGFSYVSVKKCVAGKQESHKGWKWREI